MQNTIIFYPDYSGGNPYQKLLYQPCIEAGWTVKSGTITDAKNLHAQRKNTAADLIFHIHWLNVIFANCKSHDDAWTAVESFILEATRLKSLNGKIMWTIHNHLPHENLFSEQDLRLRHFLCKHADRIHLHCGTHIEELSYLPIDIRKVAIHRHGNYIGYYGDFDLKERIKSIKEAGPKAIFVGMLRGYKGIDSLLQVAKKCRDLNIPVTIAGSPEDAKIINKIEEYSQEYGITSILRRLTESEIHTLCSDHNIGILSYDKILTSGTLKLYLSYGMSILSPTLDTIKAEDRFDSFMYTTNKDGEETDIATQLQSATPNHLAQVALKNYFLAQESRWSEDLFRI